MVLYYNMGQCMSLAISLQECLERRSASWRRFELIAKRKTDREENGTLTISFALSRFIDKNSL